MRGRLDTLFITKPKADMIVKRVEPFREDTPLVLFTIRQLWMDQGQAHIISI